MGRHFLHFTIFAALQKLVNYTFYPLLLTSFLISNEICFITPANGRDNLILTAPVCLSSTFTQDRTWTILLSHFMP
jgi:hypothetical protein